MTTKTTFSISYYCRSCKTNKQGLAPLEICININGERTFVNCPVKFFPKDFNKKRQSNEIQTIVNQYRNKVNEIIGDMMHHQQPITASTLKQWIKTGGVKVYTLDMLCTDFLNDLNCSSMLKRKYELAFNYFKSVFGADTQLENINVGMCNSLYLKLKEKFLLSTSAGYMAKCKTLFQFAVDNGKMKINPAVTVKINKGTPTISYLTTGDLNKIKSLDLSDYERLNKVRDLMLFQCSTGMAYADLINFNYNMINNVNGVCTYTNNRQKTKVEFTTVILQDGIDILNKYNGHLPLISNQRYNSYLKELQKLSGVSTVITTHLCRKSYAHYMLNNGVRIETVARLLGHSNSNITQRIYCRKTTETIANEIAQIIKVA